MVISLMCVNFFCQNQIIDNLIDRFASAKNLKHFMTLIKSISGIRGTINSENGDGLTPAIISLYTRAFAQLLGKGNKPKKIVVGRDGRMSGQHVSDIVTSTLMEMGFTIINLGLSTTPTVELAVTEEKAVGGIIISASHNPKNWNALKLLNSSGEFISAEEGQKLQKIADQLEGSQIIKVSGGTIINNNSYIDKHIEQVLSLSAVKANLIAEKHFKIVVDAINSTGALIIPQLLNKLGVQDVLVINGAVDGQFAHDPEPLAENLDELSQQVTFHNADLGIAVDPDVDRLAFVCEDGTMFGEEYTLVAVSDYLLLHEKGSTVSNLSSTRALHDITEAAGCDYYESAVGEVNVVKKMKEVKALIGGEGNGGVIYPALHYGRDAVVGIALFLTHLAESTKSALSLKASYPEYCISKNKVKLEPEVNLDDLLKNIAKKYAHHHQVKIDGLKIYFDNDWVHLRKSNTEPIIRIYAESSMETTADNMAAKLKDDIKELLS